MKKCRVGDLAWYVGDNQNRGQLFEVMQEPRRRQYYSFPDGSAGVAGIFSDWIVRSVFGPTKNYLDGGGRVPDSVYGFCRDCNLMPIRPSDEKFLEDELTRELEGVQ